jgi:hypothetical protein
MFIDLSCFQADVPLLTTHTAHVDSLHLMNSRNSGSAKIGNVAVEVEVDIEAGRAVAVVIEATMVGVMEITLVEKVVGVVRVEWRLLAMSWEKKG